MMNNKLNNILLKLKVELPLLRTQYYVTSLEVFGSYVRNEQTPKSDLDILVTFSKAPSLFKFIELEDYLSDFLSVKVDLVMRSSLKTNIGQRILAEAQLVV